MEVSDKDKRVAFNRWNFIHSLLKGMVMNTLTSMFYLQKTPDSEGVYVNCASDIKDFKTKKAYVAFMKSLDEWCIGNVIEPNDSRIVLLKKGFQTVATIIDSDHNYKKLMHKMIDTYEHITDEEIKMYAQNEKIIETHKENFAFRKNV